MYERFKKDDLLNNVLKKNKKIKKHLIIIIHFLLNSYINKM